MTLADRIRKEPMTWKDWVTAIGLLLTIGLALIRGGQMVEQLATISRQQVDLGIQLQALRADHAGTQRDITQLRGRDELHDEQIRALRREVDARSPR